MKEKITFYDRKMMIESDSGFDIHYYGELMYIKFNKPDFDFYFTGNKNYTIEISLQYMLENLPPAFTKCKRSAILNLCYIRHFRKKNPPKIIMDDGCEFKLSRKNVPEIDAKIKRLSRISPPCPVCYTCENIECDSQVVFCRQKSKPENE